MIILVLRSTLCCVEDKREEASWVAAKDITEAAIRYRDIIDNG